MITYNTIDALRRLDLKLWSTVTKAVESSANKEWTEKNVLDIALSIKNGYHSTVLCVFVEAALWEYNEGHQYGY